MGTTAMGKVTVSARIENADDLVLVKAGALPATDARSVEIADALVDTGATFLSLPLNLIEQLGLKRYRTRRARTCSGVAEFGMYGVVRLTVQGRDCFVEVSDAPASCPVLIGQIPLEALDFIVDPVGRRLIGNPEHGGEQMMDLL